MSWFPFLLFFLCTSVIHAEESQKNTPKKIEQFKAFTGKVSASKVRIRSKPDLDSPIVRQMNKGDLLLIAADAGDFWAVQPPKGTKAYVFRSYILDHVVEANHVNVRLEPHVDAPIIAQLQMGTKVEGTICPMNHKWLEIAPPASTLLYVSKEFISHAGGPDYLVTMEKRKSQVEELLHSALFLAEAECKKPYEEFALSTPMEQFQTIIRSYSDFPETVQRAKEGLALLKDHYLQKKIDYLEARAELSSSDKEALLAKHREENRELNFGDKGGSFQRLKSSFSDRSLFWDTIEESLYLSWTAFHPEKTAADFYQEQRANAIELTGTIDRYDQPIKNKPGEYILHGPDTPIGYLYSTQVDLSKYEGKEVVLLATPRPNNHFAFPAYFVLSIE